MNEHNLIIKPGEWHTYEKDEPWNISYSEIDVSSDLSGSNIIYRVVLCGYVEVTSDTDPETGKIVENVEYIKERNDIYNPKIRELTLLSPSLTMEVNTPGSLEFIMLPDHKFYDKISPMVSTIEVYENDDLIWFGRPTEVEKDFYNQKKVYCEGALGYFNDTYIGPFGEQPTDDNRYPIEWPWPDDFTLYDFIDAILGNHYAKLIVGHIETDVEERFGGFLDTSAPWYQEVINSWSNIEWARTDLLYDPPVKPVRIDIDGANYQFGSKVFTRGKITIDNKQINPLNEQQYTSTMDIINKYLLEPFGGYIVLRRELYWTDDNRPPTNYTNSLEDNYINYFDWYKDFPLSNNENEDNQPIEFGLNLLDVSYKFNGGDFCTSVIPLGPSIGEDKEPWILNFSENSYSHMMDPDQGWAMSVRPINGGYKYLSPYEDPVTHQVYNIYIVSCNGSQPFIDSEAVKVYGRIIHIEQFDDAKDREELVEKAQKYLEDTQFNSISIECSAADLHYQNGNYNKFKLGQVIHIKSTPHLIDRDFPISKMSIKLDSAAKQITLGTVPRKTLTKLQEVDKDKLKYQVISSDSYNDLSGTSNDTMYFVY